MTKSPLAQNIKFKNPEVFCVVHFKMGDGIALRGQRCRGVGINWFVGDEHSAGMNRNVRGQRQHPVGITDDEFGDVIAVAIFSVFTFTQYFSNSGAKSSQFITTAGDFSAGAPAATSAPASATLEEFVKELKDQAEPSETVNVIAGGAAGDGGCGAVVGLYC